MTVDQLALESSATPRFQAAVVGLFGVGALLLVLGGIYAITLFSVLRRRREIGVRAALGAGAMTLVAETVRRVARPLVIGTLAGGVAVIPAVSLMQRMLNQTFGSSDAPVVVATLGALLVTGVTAAFIPARGAARVPPLEAMRS